MSDGSFSGGISAPSKTVAFDWGTVAVKPQQSERVDSPEVAATRWSAIYALFGASDDSVKREVFLACLLYFTKNGASPVGKYSKAITAGGTEVLASHVVGVTGTGEGAIRQFLRARLSEATLAMRLNKVFREDPELLAAGAERGLSPEQNFLLADFLYPGNIYLTREEMNVSAVLRKAKITQANAGRGGRPVAIRGAEQNAVVEEVPVGHVEAGGSGSMVGSTMF